MTRKRVNSSASVSASTGAQSVRSGSIRRRRGEVAESPREARSNARNERKVDEDEPEVIESPAKRRAEKSSETPKRGRGRPRLVPVSSQKATPSRSSTSRGRKVRQKRKQARESSESSSSSCSETPRKGTRRKKKVVEIISDDEDEVVPQKTPVRKEIRRSRSSTPESEIMKLVARVSSGKFGPRSPTQDRDSSVQEVPIDDDVMSVTIQNDLLNLDQESDWGQEVADEEDMSFCLQDEPLNLDQELDEKPRWKRRRLPTKKNPMEVGARRHKMKRTIEKIYHRIRPVAYRMKPTSMDHQRLKDQKRTRVTRQICAHQVAQFQEPIDKETDFVPNSSVAETVEEFLSASKADMANSSGFHDECVAVGVEYDDSTKMFHFGRTMKKHSCRQKRLKFQMGWWKKYNKEGKANGKVRRPIHDVYKTSDDVHLYACHWDFVVRRSAPLNLVHEPLVNLTMSRRDQDDVIRDSAYFVREFFVPKAQISFRITRSCEIPPMYVPPTLRCGYFPLSATTVDNKKHYLASRFQEAQLEYFHLTYRDVKPKQGFKAGSITPTELYNFHRLGKHIHGFFLVWELDDPESTALNKRYLVDMFHHQFFPLDIEYMKWEHKLRVAFDLVTVYNLQLAEIVRVNRPVLDTLAQNKSFFQPVTLLEIITLMHEQGMNPKQYAITCGNDQLYEWGVNRCNEDYLSAYFMITGGSKVITSKEDCNLEYARATISEDLKNLVIAKNGQPYSMNLSFSPTEILASTEDSHESRELRIRVPMSEDDMMLTNLITDTPHNNEPKEIVMRKKLRRGILMTRRELIEFRRKAYGIPAPRPKKKTNKPRQKKKPGRKAVSKVERALKMHDFSTEVYASDVESEYEGYLSESEDVRGGYPTLKRSMSAESVFIESTYTDYFFDTLSALHSQRFSRPEESLAKKRRRKMNRLVRKHALRFGILETESKALPELLKCYSGHMPALATEIARTKLAMRKHTHYKHNVPKVFRLGDGKRIDIVADTLRKMVAQIVAQEHVIVRAENSMTRAVHNSRVTRQNILDELREADDSDKSQRPFLAIDFLSRRRIHGKAALKAAAKELRTEVSTMCKEYMKLSQADRLNKMQFEKYQRGLVELHEMYSFEEYLEIREDRTSIFVTYGKGKKRAAVKSDETRRENREKLKEKQQKRRETGFANFAISEGVELNVRGQREEPAEAEKRRAEVKTAQQVMEEHRQRQLAEVEQQMKKRRESAQRAADEQRKKERAKTEQLRKVQEAKLRQLTEDQRREKEQKTARWKKLAAELEEKEKDAEQREKRKKEDEERWQTLQEVEEDLEVYRREEEARKMIQGEYETEQQRKDGEARRAEKDERQRQNAKDRAKAEQHKPVSEAEQREKDRETQRAAELELRRQLDKRQEQEDARQKQIADEERKKIKQEETRKQKQAEYRQKRTDDAVRAAREDRQKQLARAEQRRKAEEESRLKQLAKKEEAARRASQEELLKQKHTPKRNQSQLGQDRRPTIESLNIDHGFVPVSPTKSIQEHRSLSRMTVESQVEKVTDWMSTSILSTQPEEVADDLEQDNQDISMQIDDDEIVELEARRNGTSPSKSHQSIPPRPATSVNKKVERIPRSSQKNSRSSTSEVATEGPQRKPQSQLKTPQPSTSGILVLDPKGTTQTQQKPSRPSTSGTLVVDLERTPTQKPSTSETKGPQRTPTSHQNMPPRRDLKGTPATPLKTPRSLTGQTLQPMLVRLTVDGAAYNPDAFHLADQPCNEFWNLLQIAETTQGRVNRVLKRRQIPRFISEQKSYRAAGAAWTVGVLAVSSILLTGISYNQESVPSEEIEIDDGDKDLRAALNRLVEVSVMFDQAAESPEDLQILVQHDGFRMVLIPMIHMFKHLLALFVRLGLDRMFENEIKDEKRILKLLEVVRQKMEHLIPAICGAPEEDIKSLQNEEEIVAEHCDFLEDADRSYPRPHVITNWFRHILVEETNPVEEIRKEFFGEFSKRKTVLETSGTSTDGSAASKRKLVLEEGTLRAKDVEDQRGSISRPAESETVVLPKHKKILEEDDVQEMDVEDQGTPNARSDLSNPDILTDPIAHTVSPTIPVTPKEDKNKEKSAQNPIALERKRMVQNISQCSDEFLSGMFSAMEKTISELPLANKDNAVRKPHVSDSPHLFSIAMKDPRVQESSNKLVPISAKQLDTYKDVILNSFPNEVVPRETFNRLQWTVRSQGGGSKRAIEYFTDLEKYQDESTYEMHLPTGSLPFEFKIFTLSWFLGYLLPANSSNNGHHDYKKSHKLCPGCTNGDVILVHHCTCANHQDQGNPDRFIYTETNLPLTLQKIQRLSGRFVCEHGPSSVLVLTQKGEFPKAENFVQKSRHTVHSGKVSLHRFCVRDRAPTPEVIDLEEETRKSEDSESRQLPWNRRWRSKSCDPHHKEVKLLPLFLKSSSMIDLQDLEKYAHWKIEKLEKERKRRSKSWATEKLQTQLSDRNDNSSPEGPSHFQMIGNIFGTDPADFRNLPETVETLTNTLQQCSLLKIQGGDNKNLPKFDENGVLIGGKSISPVMDEYLSFMQYGKILIAQARRTVAHHHNKRDDRFFTLHNVHRQVWNINIRLLEHLIHRISQAVFTPVALYEAERTQDLTSIRKLLEKVKKEMPTVVNSFLNEQPLKRQIFDLEQCLKDKSVAPHMEQHLASLGRFAIERIRVPRCASKLFEDHPWVNKETELLETIDLLRVDITETRPSTFNPIEFLQCAKEKYYDTEEIMARCLNLNPGNVPIITTLYKAFWRQSYEFYRVLVGMLPNNTMDRRMRTFYEYQSFLRLRNIMTRRSALTSDDVAALHGMDLTMVYSGIVSNPPKEPGLAKELKTLTKTYNRLCTQQTPQDLPIPPSYIGNTFVCFDTEIVVAMVCEKRIRLEELQLVLKRQHFKERGVQFIKNETIASIFLNIDTNQINVEIRPEKDVARDDRVHFEIPDVIISQQDPFGAIGHVIGSRLSRLYKQLKSRISPTTISSRLGRAEHPFAVQNSSEPSTSSQKLN